MTVRYPDIQCSHFVMLETKIIYGETGIAFPKAERADCSTVFVNFFQF